jgi:hypothetical protein
MVTMSTTSPELSGVEPWPPSDVEVGGGVAVAASTEEVPVGV